MSVLTEVRVIEKLKKIKATVHLITPTKCNANTHTIHVYKCQQLLFKVNYCTFLFIFQV